MVGLQRARRALITLAPVCCSGLSPHRVHSRGGTRTDDATMRSDAIRCAAVRCRSARETADAGLAGANGAEAVANGRPLKPLARRGLLVRGGLGSRDGRLSSSPDDGSREQTETPDYPLPRWADVGSSRTGCSNRDAESQCYHVWHGVLDKDVSPSCTNSKQARAAWWSE